ncbi:helix-turn-helix transcriptional regulator [Streptomyces albireticuli]|nr:helix-turn-helix domain-containing protein [Streptomyces albireticuli]MCD9145782.1 helix-turn-helix domain-containing protein [Streptomyces albireticuli]MCD9165859.1 helix-turn-helix domain-containing protein [Streptomyces albireticuli]MCD9194462.1 helix-turn-helix domain-containing protein [Streptomyces albireticuli]
MSNEILRILQSSLTLAIITEYHAMMQAIIAKISTGVMMDKIEWLTSREVATQLRVHPGTLANWRHQGIGPRYTKLSTAPNSAVRYRSDHVESYLREQERRAAA